MTGEAPKESWVISILKYFAHGVLFSVLATVFIFVAAEFLALLATLGAGGILLAIAALYIVPIVLGAANCVITEFLWFPVKFSWLSTWLHGILMFLALIVVNLIALMPFSVLPLTAAIILSLITGAFIDGYLAKQIAELWKKEKKE